MKILSKIQKELKAPKGQYNSFSSFHYRSCEDILEAVKPLLGEATLTIEDEIVLIGDRYYVKATATLVEPLNNNEMGKYSASAYAREPLEKKGMDSAQITGATSSYARKYALNGLFCIDDAKDPDSKDNREVKVVKVENKIMTPEEALSNAKKAIEESTSIDDLTLVSKNIKKSKNLTDTDKETLIFSLNEKLETFDPLKD